MVYVHAVAEISTGFSLSVENEQVNAGRDGQTCLARPNRQARTGTAGHEQDWLPGRFIPCWKC